MPPIAAWFRLVLAVLFGALALTLYLLGQSLWAAWTALPGFLMLLAWVRYHDVPRAAMAFNGQDKERAWELLAGVPWGGRLLAGKCRVYYHHVRARCLLQREDWPAAAREAEAALRLSSITDEAPGCHVAAAHAYAQTGDKDRAAEHLAAARDLPHNESVKRGIQRIERLLADA